MIYIHNALFQLKHAPNCFKIYILLCGKNQINQLKEAILYRHTWLLLKLIGKQSPKTSELITNIPDNQFGCSKQQITINQSTEQP